MLCLTTLLLVGEVRATEWVVGAPGEGEWRHLLGDGRTVENMQIGSSIRRTLVNRGNERRLYAFEAPVACEGGVQSITFPCEVSLASGTARLAVVAVKADGDTWFKLAGDTPRSNGVTEVGMSLVGMTRAAFNSAAESEVDWKDIRRLQVGLVLDGPAEVTFTLGRARLSDQPYRASLPRDLQSPANREWQHAADPAAHVELTTPGEGQGGTECWRFDFSFPGKRHMFAVPSTPLEDVDVAAYRAIELTYKAKLPEGIPGLLFMLIERDGTQYFAEPPPPPSEEWRKLAVPFENFKRGAWSEDDNDRLDLDGIGSIAVAVHGVAKPVRAEGTVWVSRMRLVP